MKTAALKELVRRYNEGTTTADEEETLRGLFLSGSYPPEFEAEAMQFRFYAEAEKEGLPGPEFRARMEQVFAEDSTARTYPRIVRFRMVLTAAAAVMLILVGTFFTVRYHSMQKQAAEKLAAEELYRDTRQALLFLSGKYNTGIDNVLSLRKFSSASGSGQASVHKDPVN